MNVESNGQRYSGKHNTPKSEIANRNRKSPIEIANRNRQSSLRLFHNKQNKQKQFLFVSYICFRKTAT